MQQFFADLAQFDFWRRAVIGGIVISAVCSLLSVYVVLKRMAFIGQGISHSAFGGFALGVLLFGGAPGTEAKVYATALLFCLAIAFFIGATTRHSRVSSDSAIGIFFVVSMALGIIFFSQTPGYSQDPSSYLFGSIVALTQAELIIMCVLSAAVAAVLLLLQKELMYYSFDEEMAALSGVPATFLHYMLLTVLSLMVVVSVRMIGIILISAFLILPGTMGHLLARRFSGMIIWSLVAGVSTTLLGLVMSWYTDWPTGATIVLVQFAAFACLLLMRKAQGTLSAR